MSKYKCLIILLVILMCFTAGCSIKLKTREINENNYESVGNEMELFGFGMEENTNNVLHIMGEPDKATGSKFEYSKEKVRVLSSENKVAMLIITNPDFKLFGEISIGTTKENLVQEYSHLDIFEYVNPKEKKYLFFREKNQKVVLEMDGEKIKKIIISKKDIPFDKIISGNVNEKSIQTDEELILKSKFLTFHLDLLLNNSKLMSEHFKEYAEIGLIEGVPIPVGTSKSDITRMYGDADYHFQGNGKIDYIYFYKRFNLYLGFDSNDKLVEIRMPIFVKKIEFQEMYSLDHAIRLKDFIIEFEEKDGMIVNVFLSTENL